MPANNADLKLLFSVDDQRFKEVVDRLTHISRAIDGISTSFQGVRTQSATTFSGLIEDTKRYNSALDASKTKLEELSTKLKSIGAMSILPSAGATVAGSFTTKVSAGGGSDVALGKSGSHFQKTIAQHLSIMESVVGKASKDMDDAVKQKIQDFAKILSTAKRQLTMVSSPSEIAGEVNQLTGLLKDLKGLPETVVKDLNSKLGKLKYDMFNRTIKDMESQVSAWYNNPSEVTRAQVQKVLSQNAGLGRTLASSGMSNTNLMARVSGVQGKVDAFVMEDRPQILSAKAAKDLRAEFMTASTRASTAISAKDPAAAQAEIARMQNYLGQAQKFALMEQGGFSDAMVDRWKAMMEAKSMRLGKLTAATAGMEAPVPPGVEDRASLVRIAAIQRTSAALERDMLKAQKLSQREDQAWQLQQIGSSIDSFKRAAKQDPSQFIRGFQSNDDFFKATQPFTNAQGSINLFRSQISSMPEGLEKVRAVQQLARFEARMERAQAPIGALQARIDADNSPEAMLTKLVTRISASNVDLKARLGGLDPASLRDQASMGSIRASQRELLGNVGRTLGALGAGNFGALGIAGTPENVTQAQKALLAVQKQLSAELAPAATASEKILGAFTRWAAPVFLAGTALRAVTNLMQEAVHSAIEYDRVLYRISGQITKLPAAQRMGLGGAIRQGAAEDASRLGIDLGRAADINSVFMMGSTGSLEDRRALARTAANLDFTRTLTFEESQGLMAPMRTMGFGAGKIRNVLETMNILQGQNQLTPDRMRAYKNALSSNIPGLMGMGMDLETAQAASLFEAAATNDMVMGSKMNRIQMAFRNPKTLNTLRQVLSRNGTRSMVGGMDIEEIINNGSPLNSMTMLGDLYKRGAFSQQEMGRISQTIDMWSSPGTMQMLMGGLDKSKEQVRMATAMAERGVVSSDEQVKEQTKALGVEFDKLKQNLTLLVGEGLTPVMRILAGLLNVVNPLLKAMTEFSGVIQIAGTAAVALAAAMATGAANAGIKNFNDFVGGGLTAGAFGRKLLGGALGRTATSGAGALATTALVGADGLPLAAAGASGLGGGAAAAGGLGLSGLAATAGIGLLIGGAIWGVSKYNERQKEKEAEAQAIRTSVSERGIRDIVGQETSAAAMIDVLGQIEKGTLRIAEAKKRVLEITDKQYEAEVNNAKTTKELEEITKRALAEKAAAASKRLEAGQGASLLAEAFEVSKSGKFTDFISRVKTTKISDPSLKAALGGLVSEYEAGEAAKAANTEVRGITSGADRFKALLSGIKSGGILTSLAQQGFNVDILNPTKSREGLQGGIMKDYYNTSLYEAQISPTQTNLGRLIYAGMNEQGTSREGSMADLVKLASTSNQLQASMLSVLHQIAGKALTPAEAGFSYGKRSDAPEELRKFIGADGKLSRESLLELNKRPQLKARFLADYVSANKGMTLETANQIFDNALIDKGFIESQIKAVAGARVKPSRVDTQLKPQDWLGPFGRRASLMDNAAAGGNIGEVMRQFPQLSADAIDAALEKELAQIRKSVGLYDADTGAMQVAIEEAKAKAEMLKAKGSPNNLKKLLFRSIPIIMREGYEPNKQEAAAGLQRIAGQEEIERDARAGVMGQFSAAQLAGMSDDQLQALYGASDIMALQKKLGNYSVERANYIKSLQLASGVSGEDWLDKLPLEKRAINMQAIAANDKILDLQRGVDQRELVTKYKNQRQALLKYDLAGIDVSTAKGTTDTLFASMFGTDTEKIHAQERLVDAQIKAQEARLAAMEAAASDELSLAAERKKLIDLQIEAVKVSKETLDAQKQNAAGQAFAKNFLADSISGSASGRTARWGNMALSTFREGLTNRIVDMWNSNEFSKGGNPLATLGSFIFDPLGFGNSKKGEDKVIASQKELVGALNALRGSIESVRSGVAGNQAKGGAFDSLGNVLTTSGTESISLGSPATVAAGLGGLLVGGTALGKLNTSVSGFSFGKAFNKANGGLLTSSLGTMTLDEVMQENTAKDQQQKQQSGGAVGWMSKISGFFNNGNPFWSAGKDGKGFGAGRTESGGLSMAGWGAAVASVGMGYISGRQQGAGYGAGVKDKSAAAGALHAGAGVAASVGGPYGWAAAAVMEVAALALQAKASSDAAAEDAKRKNELMEKQLAEASRQVNILNEQRTQMGLVAESILAVRAEVANAFKAVPSSAFLSGRFGANAPIQIANLTVLANNPQELTSQLSKALATEVRRG